MNSVKGATRTIHVTMRDIQEGVPGFDTECPIALATRRAFPEFEDVRIRFTNPAPDYTPNEGPYAFVYGNCFALQFHCDIHTFIRDFDQQDLPKEERDKDHKVPEPFDCDVTVGEMV
jgi:hypothetical protein